MEENYNQDFNGPIPGASLTHELGSQPDEKPPMFSDPADAYEDIATRLVQEESVKRISVAAELGVPMEIIARSIVFAGWAKGRYTIDTMYLIFGPVFEVIMSMLDAANVEYVDLAERAEDESLNKMMDMLEKRKDFIGETVSGTSKGDDDEPVEEDTEEELEEEESEVPTGGLMGRPE
jgi:hypothetical protein